MLDNIKAVLVDEDGASLVEYALLVSLIAAVCIGVMTTMGTKISAMFTSVNGHLNPTP